MIGNIAVLHSTSEIFGNVCRTKILVARRTQERSWYLSPRASCPLPKKKKKPTRNGTCTRRDETKHEDVSEPKKFNLNQARLYIEPLDCTDNTADLSDAPRRHRRTISFPCTYVMSSTVFFCLFFFYCCFILVYSNVSSLRRMRRYRFRNEGVQMYFINILSAYSQLWFFFSTSKQFGSTASCCVWPGQRFSIAITV